MGGYVEIVSSCQDHFLAVVACLDEKIFVALISQFIEQRIFSRRDDLFGSVDSLVRVYLSIPLSLIFLPSSLIQGYRRLQCKCCALRDDISIERPTLVKHKLPTTSPKICFTLKLHISLVGSTPPLYTKIIARLMNFRSGVNAKQSNQYSPPSWSRVLHPVISLNESDDNWGTKKHHLKCPQQSQLPIPSAIHQGPDRNSLQDKFSRLDFYWRNDATNRQ